MRINLISRDNGVGLSQDIQLLRDFLRQQQHAVRVFDFEGESQEADVNIYLELFHQRHLATASKHVGIFNLEWFERAWEPFLSTMTQLWAKSAKAFEWYRERGLDQAVYTGFLSRDMMDKTVLRQRRVLHIRGQSTAKGTTAVVEAWKKAGDKLPELTIVSVDPVCEVIPRVTQWIGRITDEKLRELMNEHAYHLCPSTIEGWGHYVTEALSCGAIVATTDASPMNEHVLPSFGRLLDPAVIRTQHGLDYCHVNADSVIEAISELDALDAKELNTMQRKARVWWALRQTNFSDAVTKMLARLA